MTTYNFEIDLNLLAESPDGIVIGRDPALCDLIATDANLAPRHLRVRLSGDGVTIEDLNSEAGTTIGGEALTPFDPVPLPLEREVRMGGVPVHLNLVQRAAAAPEYEQESALPAASRGRRPRRALKIVAILVIGVVGILGMMVAYGTYQDRLAEDRAWESALSSGTPESIRGYLEGYPDGRHRGLAETVIANIEQARADAEAAIEAEAFTMAQAIGAPEAYAIYLERYPDGKFVEDAKLAVRELEEEEMRRQEAEAEEAAWEQAGITNSVKAYRAYLAGYPKGLHAAEAQAEIDRLTAAAETADRKRREAEAQRQREAEEKRSREAEEKRQREAAQRQQQQSRQQPQQSQQSQQQSPQQAGQSGTATWDVARQADTVAAYERFLRDNPNAPEAATAKNNIGWLYANGTGVTEDDQKAITWFRQAAADGNRDAMLNLGYHYHYGLGVAKNPEEAAKWYRQAIDAGDKRAADLLNLLQRETGVQ